MAAELPDNTDVFIPGETVADPPCIPEDQLVEKPWNPYETPWEWSLCPNWPIRAPK